jgi:hypothetical protein
MTHTVTFCTRTGGLYTATATPDGLTTVTGIASNGRHLRETGTVAGFCVHPDLAASRRVFYLGDADPVDHHDGQTVYDHTRLIRTGPVALILIDGEPVTPAQAHELAPVDHLRVPLGNGVFSDPDLGPVVTCQEGAYLPEILADLFGPTGPLFAEII